MRGGVDHLFFSTYLLAMAVKFVCFLFAMVSSCFSIDVNTEAGLVRGKFENFGDSGVQKFLGIPYAESPIGELRFKPPVPKTRHQGILHANKTGNICPQSAHNKTFFNFTDDPDNNWNMDEDCLYLNIYVPTTSDGSLPSNLAVMFYIHSGGWTWGSGSHYDGRWLAMHGNVILVTFNYRLGILGFLRTDDGQIVNNGLRDQILALKWVNKNIRNFGGDPDLITIFGQSAGGASVTYLQTVKEVRGMFQRGIALAGLAGSSWSNFTALGRRNLTEHISAASGCYDNYLDCLRGKSAEELVDVSALVTKSTHLLTAWMPSPDGDLIAESIADPYGGKEVLESMSRVDFLTGMAASEGTSIICYVAAFSGKEIPNLEDSSTKVSFDDIKLLSLLGDLRPDAEEIMSDFVGHTSERAMPWATAVDFVTEYVATYPAYQLARAHERVASKNGRKTYLFEFDHVPVDKRGIFPRPAWLRKTVHGDELPMIFGVPLSRVRDEAANEVDLEVSKVFITYLTNFAKTGNPNHPEPVQVEWLNFDTDKRKSHYFSSNGPVQKVFQLPLKTTQYWDKLYGLDKQYHDEL